VPAGSAAALICDTGALIDYLVESAPDHVLFRDAIDRARTRYVPGLVLAEVDYFLRAERQAICAAGTRATHARHGNLDRHCRAFIARSPFCAEGLSERPGTYGYFP
jgi:predicted nucleic acid-binding protein